MIVIGVTGGVGMGKSTVAKMLARKGAVVLDADALSHEAMEPKKLAWRKIVKAFGERVLNDDQTIRRQQLAAVVFRDAQQRQRLEQILHPQVLRMMKQQIQRLRRSCKVNAVVVDVPLLLEAGGSGLVDALVVVTARPEVQRQRLKNAHGWTDEEIDARMAAQWDVSAKAALADVVVENSDGVDRTRTQVDRLWNRLVAQHSSK
ncbi:MAG: dephospho-CoA kinase [Candidatus Omnitrophica bacterium]|nr:dephospho-CoA kinase [Candidatus Omnitrophota bacterium]